MLRKLLGPFLAICCSIFVFWSFRPAWIEWDKVDNSIHGKSVIFTKQMSYVSLGEEHLASEDAFLEYEVRIGRLLLEYDTDYFNKVAYRSENTSYELLPIDYEFTIEGTYWIRHNWLVRSFAGDSRRALLKDPKGKYAVLPFFYFAASTQKKFSELDYIYRER